MNGYHWRMRQSRVAEIGKCVTIRLSDRTTIRLFDLHLYLVQKV